MSLLAAGTPEMSLPSISTSPASAYSKPATIRSAVVFPQPDGPSRATSSPGAISSDIWFSALVWPNTRVRPRSDTLVPPRAPAGPAPATPVTAVAAVSLAPVAPGAVSLPAISLVAISFLSSGVRPQ